MWRILFLLLWCSCIFQSISQGAIEIFVDGHKYHSMQEYREAKKILVDKSAAATAVLDKQQEVDNSKTKTIWVKPKKISDATKHQLYVLSVENGVIGALQNFYQTSGDLNSQIAPKISTEQLQAAIETAVTKSKSPKLIISEPGKMRILTVSSNNSQQ